jgi:hypothetical protein
LHLQSTLPGGATIEIVRHGRVISGPPSWIGEGAGLGVVPPAEFVVPRGVYTVRVRSRRGGRGARGRILPLPLSES